MRLLIALAFLLALSGCMDQDIQFTEVFSEKNTNQRVAADYVIDSEEDWEQMWEEFFSHITPPPTRPRIDFSREMILIVCLGERPSTGYKAVVENITRTDGMLRVRYSEIEPEGLVGMMITYPCTAVSIPHSDLPVAFERI